MSYPQSPKRSSAALRILLWIIAGIILGVALCCGGLFIAGTVSVSPNR